MSKLNCMVAQSGGPTCAINSSLAGVIKEAASSGFYDKIYGSVNGIMGIFKNNILDLSKIFYDDIDRLDKLKHTPSMYLGSCRYKLPALDNLSYSDEYFTSSKECYDFIFSQFKKYNIGAFFYIGGNDSMDTVLKLSAYGKEINSDIRIIGIPKTIDNDLMVTDHTPGFGSAAKYIAASMLEIAHDTYIYAVKSVTIVEIMGRDSGWLTAASILARNEYNAAPHLIYLPESNFNKDEFLEDVRKELETRSNVIVAVSEGIHDSDGNYISASTGKTDNFGHSQLSGAGKTLEYLISDNIDVKVRSIEINVLQRCAAHLTSKTDLDEAFKLGQAAVRYAADGLTSIMVTINRTSDTPYTTEYSYAQIQNIANEAKKVPVEWINGRGNDLTPEIVTYLNPLIQGETAPTYINGIPSYMNVEHLT